jgi:four helix bundle protein
MRSNLIVDKTYQFSQRIIKANQFLIKKKEYVISKQLLKSGTSIGANITEAIYAQSKKDFLHKMNIALKEAGETEYWINQIIDSGLFGDHWGTLKEDCLHIKRIIHSIVKTTKNNLNHS